MKINVLENGVVVTREMTAEEEKVYQEAISQVSVPVELQISELKQKLAETQQETMLYTEGIISEEEYAPIKAERTEIWRQIKELQNKQI